MAKKKGQLVVISGPSGAGKGTVLKKLFEKHEDFAYSISVTTRQPRPGEVDGREYYFKTYDQFKEMMHNKEFLEVAEVYGNYYGTPVFGVNKLISEGKNVVLEIDTVGALNVKKKFPTAELIFIIPPTIEQLTERLTNRRTETEEQLKLRLSSALEEIKKLDQYDHVVINDDPDVAAEEVFAIVRAAYCTTKRNKTLVNKFLGGKL